MLSYEHLCRMEVVEAMLLGLVGPGMLLTPLFLDTVVVALGIMRCACSHAVPYYRRYARGGGMGSVRY